YSDLYYHGNNYGNYHDYINVNYDHNSHVCHHINYCFHSDYHRRVAGNQSIGVGIGINIPTVTTTTTTTATTTSTITITPNAIALTATVPAAVTVTTTVVPTIQTQVTVTATATALSTLTVPGGVSVIPITQFQATTVTVTSTVASTIMPVIPATVAYTPVPSATSTFIPTTEEPGDSPRLSPFVIAAIVLFALLALAALVFFIVRRRKQKGNHNDSADSRVRRWLFFGRYQNRDSYRASSRMPRHQSRDSYRAPSRMSELTAQGYSQYKQSTSIYRDSDYHNNYHYHGYYDIDHYHDIYNHFFHDFYDNIHNHNHSYVVVNRPLTNPGNAVAPVTVTVTAAVGPNGAVPATVTATTTLVSVVSVTGPVSIIPVTQYVATTNTVTTTVTSLVAINAPGSTEFDYMTSTTQFGSSTSLPTDGDGGSNEPPVNVAAIVAIILLALLALAALIFFIRRRRKQKANNNSYEDTRVRNWWFFGRKNDRDSHRAPSRMSDLTAQRYSVAVVTETYGLVAANCLQLSSTGTADLSQKYQVSISGNNDTMVGTFDITKATINPNFDPTTMANNLAIVYYDASSKGKISNAIADWPAEWTSYYFVHQTLTKDSTPLWNSPLVAVSKSQSDPADCAKLSTLYGQNKVDLICSQMTAPTYATKGCVAPFGSLYGVTSSNLALGALFSHSASSGSNGLCGTTPVYTYYIILRNYLAWVAKEVGSQVPVYHDTTSGYSAQTNAGYAMGSSSSSSTTTSSTLSSSSVLAASTTVASAASSSSSSSSSSAAVSATAAAVITAFATAATTIISTVTLPAATVTVTTTATAPAVVSTVTATSVITSVSVSTLTVTPAPSVVEPDMTQQYQAVISDSGNQMFGTFNIDRIIMHPAYDIGTFANNLAIVFFDASSKGAFSNAVADWPPDWQSYYFVHHSLTNRVPATWNAPIIKTASTAASDPSGCSAYSKVYDLNSSSFVCSTLTLPWYGNTSCEAPFNTVFGASGSSSAVAAIYSHSAIPGTGAFCGKGTVYNYYTILQHYVGWISSTIGSPVSVLHSSGSGYTPSTTSAYSMRVPPNHGIIDGVQVFAGYRNDIAIHGDGSVVQSFEANEVAVAGALSPGDLFLSSTSITQLPSAAASTVTATVTSTTTATATVTSVQTVLVTTTQVVFTASGLQTATATPEPLPTTLSTVTTPTTTAEVVQSTVASIPLLPTVLTVTITAAPSIVLVTLPPQIQTVFSTTTSILTSVVTTTLPRNSQVIADLSNNGETSATGTLQSHATDIASSDTPMIDSSHSGSVSNVPKGVIAAIVVLAALLVSALLLFAWKRKRQNGKSNDGSMSRVRKWLFGKKFDNSSYQRHSQPM
ncbi:hypothetical protein EV174_004183, partial [Coemansia sp. RSA 2320]